MKPLVSYLTSAWTATVAIGAIYFLVRGAQAAGIDGYVTGIGFGAICALGGASGGYRLARREN